MKNSLPKVHNHFLHQISPEENTSNTILIGSHEWYKWLEQRSRFSFATGSGAFMAFKKRQTEAWYW